MNADEIRKWHSTFKREGELFEIRILGDRTWSGYFYDVEQAIQALTPYDQMNIYYTVNPIQKACASRSQFGVFQMVKGTATSKTDIQKRLWIPVDVDAERPSGVSSTATEKQMAYAKASEVYYFLTGNGLPQPVVCDSSSGYHLLIPIDMENSLEAESAVKQFLETLSMRFTDDHVKIDTVLFDANRILRLPGSYGRKGRSTEERPHRMAHIMSTPEQTHRMTLAELQAFNDRYKVVSETVTRKWNGGGSQEAFNLRDFISQHGIEVDREVAMPGGGTKFVLKECPWDSSHKSPDSAIFELPNGAIAFKCYHNSCSHHDWHELRLKLDPTAYDPKPQPYQPPMQYQRLPQAILPQPTVILPETAEKGKKWLSMKDIKKVNIDEMQGFVTGITELDRAIRKLYYGEVTILSGSNASGKTSLLNMLILNAVQQGVPNALYSGELPPKKLKMWIQTVAAGKDFLRMSHYGDSWYVPDHIGQKIDDWLDGRFFIFNDEGYSHRWEQLLSDMTDLAKAGVKFFTLDNLMSMSIDIFNGDNNKKQKELINQIVGFAKEFQAHVILVAHPRKATGFIRKTDIAGTSDLSNAVDNVFIVHRVNNDFKKLGGEFFGQTTISRYFGYGNVIECCKNRAWGVMDQLYGIYYEIESRRFKNSPTEQRQYGWRDDVAQQQNMFATPAQPQQSDMPFEATDENAPF